MHPADISAALKKLLVSHTSIARHFDITPTGVRNVIAGRYRSQRIEQRIAEIVGLPLNQLWPQWYAADVHDDPSTRMTELERFRTRLNSELQRLNLTPPMISAFTVGRGATLRPWLAGARSRVPDAEDLIELGKTTRIDLAYVMTGRREVGRA